MDLAREAASQATKIMHARPDGPSIPGSAAAALEEAEIRARRRQPNYALVFAQISRSVRQCLALQAHLLEGRLQPPATARASRDKTPPAVSPSPHPNHANIIRLDGAERPDWVLPAGPDGEVSIEHLLQTIRQDLGLATAQPAPPDDPAIVDNPERQPKNPGLAPGAPKTPKNWRPPAAQKFSG